MLKKLKKLLIDQVTASGPSVTCAVFGKHPGWDDHMEEIGLDSSGLVALRRLLYSEGLATNIDTGVWEALDAEDCLEEFDHAFVRRTPESVIVGRLWSSRDGRGRTKYPMIVCAEFVGVDTAWAIKTALPVLDDAYTGFVATADSAEVARAVSDAADRLRVMLKSDVDRATASSPTPKGVYGDLMELPGIGSDRERLARVLYGASRELGALIGRPESGTGSISRYLAGSGQIRLPRGSVETAESLVLWLRFLDEMVGPSSSAMLIQPLREDWTDLVIGDPSPEQLVCLRESSHRLPPATEIPYSIDPQFHAAVDQLLSGPQ